MEYDSFGWDFTNGTKIDEEDIKEWRQKILEHLTNSESTVVSISSGNSILIGLKRGGEGVEIIEVTNGYKTTTYISNHKN